MTGPRPETPHRRGARKRSKRHCAYCGAQLLRDEVDEHTAKHKGEEPEYLYRQLAEFIVDAKGDS